MSNPKLKITKMDAAKRQLETAIELYFNDADPVSIHTLAGAAHTIISDLNNKNNGEPMSISDRNITEEYKKEFRDKINEAKNHFKHADKDPEATIDFNPEVNELYIFDACEKYIELTSEKPRNFLIFRAWFLANHPNVLVDSKENTEFIERNKAVLENKAKFFSNMKSVSGLAKR